MLTTKSLRIKLNPSILHRAINHPDPLTRQQTQRFLDAVTTSFRNNLDKEHGWPVSQPAASSLAHSPTGESQGRSTPPSTDAESDVVTNGADGPPRRRPTDHHMASILSSPLFRPAPRLTQKPASKRDPMDVFDEAVSKGLMTVPIATGCLKAKKSMLGDSGSPFLDDQQSASNGRFLGFNVSDRVLGWLRSSGMMRTFEFTHHPTFVGALMPFLVAEGKDVVIWDWLTRLMSSSEVHSKESFAAARHILLLLVQSKAMGVECVDSAFESIIQASETYRDDPRHGHLLVRAWRDVAWRATFLAWQKPSPSASLFDAYLGVADYLYTSHTKLPVAHLHLHHPATPTHDRALDYFGQTKKREKDIPVERLRREAMMGVDTVNHLGLIGNLEEAKSLMDFIQNKYSFYFQKAHAGNGDELLGLLEPA
ncbi:uncharacterized protein DNG_06950 [Cephalotrichum gorgonifer]|uniref:Uncharacterized protein n=1 Tax=Cephalotrichum gorgonifer TaxID=2041049 RepID=A0AAE8N1L0_9PEZI|nr:uncharacterized protein DNG_06950 [Cephalotrichum gorgonifer]